MLGRHISSYHLLGTYDSVHMTPGVNARKTYIFLSFIMYIRLGIYDCIALTPRHMHTHNNPLIYTAI